ncbi:MAG TPA: hypothetical protein VGN87_16565 [Paenibacillus sp.]
MEEIEKHLQSCEKCLQSYNEMTATANLNLPIVDQEEVKKLNYFKKVNTKNTKTLVFSLLTVIILATALVGLFVIGFPLSSKDVTIDYQKSNVIGSETRYKPRSLLHDPFDDVGTQAMLGTEIRADLDYSNKFILELR